MPCLLVSDDPGYNVSFRVLKGSGGGAEHWLRSHPQLEVVEPPDLIYFRFVIIIISVVFFISMLSQYKSIKT